MSASAPAVFISYRREDSSGHAGRLHDTLKQHFRDLDVFIDVELGPGKDFVKAITDAVSGCRALLVVIGPQWACTDGQAQPGITDPGKFVRLEVETALDNAEIAVIPLLVAGARMPKPEELPPPLRPLARLNALELSDLRWPEDAGRLERALKELLEGTVGVDDVVQTTSTTSRALDFAPLLLEGVVVAAVAGVLARSLGDGIRLDGDAWTVGPSAMTVLRRAETWMLVAGALAVWLSLRRGERAGLARRTSAGLLLGALAGAVGGLIVVLPPLLLGHSVQAHVSNQISIASLAVTGGLLGAVAGHVWIPRRVALGCFGGALGGMLVQLGTNDWGRPHAIAGLPADAWATGLQCIVIVGVALAGMLWADAWATTASSRTGMTALAPADR